jgi:hypothetical protein
MNWLKSFFGLRTWLYSDPFLVNDAHLSAHYYQIRRCVQTNEIDFVRVKQSPIVGLESAVLPPTSVVRRSQETALAIHRTETAEILTESPRSWKTQSGGEAESASAA